MERDRDLLEIFDAVLPRLPTYPPGSVPKAGAREMEEYETRAKDRRGDLAVFGGATAIFAVMTWAFWFPWMPVWMLGVMAAVTGACGAGTAKRFLQLAFGPRLEQALPAGTDARTAELEDGTWAMIRSWNADAFVWNGQAAALRGEVSEWQLLRLVPEARDIEWSEAGSRTRAEGLLAAMRGLSADRAALLARKEAIDHRLRTLQERLLLLEASEEPEPRALPPAREDPPDDG